MSFKEFIRPTYIKIVVFIIFLIPILFYYLGTIPLGSIYGQISQEEVLIQLTPLGLQMQAYRYCCENTSMIDFGEGYCADRHQFRCEENAAQSEIFCRDTDWNVTSDSDCVRLKPIYEEYVRSKEKYRLKAELHRKLTYLWLIPWIILDYLVACSLVWLIRKFRKK